MNENENNITPNEEQNTNLQNNLGEMPINNNELNSQPEVINTSIPSEPVINEAPVEPTVNESQIVEPVTPIEEPVTTQPIETPVVTNTETTNTPAPKKKNVAGIIIGIIAGSLVLLIIVIVAIVLMFRGAFNKVLKGNTNTNTSTSTNTSTTTRKTTVSNDTQSPYKTRKSKANPKVYIDLSNMTGEEIVTNILDLTEISNGDSAYNYTDRFIYESPNYILMNKAHVFGRAGSWSFKDFSKDAYITHIAIYNVEEKDDGTLVIKDNPQVQVSLEFKTYEKAKETFDAITKLYEKMGETFDKPKDDGESIHLKYDKQEYFTSFNNPTKEGRPYTMYTWIPIMYFMEEK